MYLLWGRIKLIQIWVYLFDIIEKKYSADLVETLEKWKLFKEK